MPRKYSSRKRSKSRKGRTYYRKSATKKSKSRKAYKKRTRSCRVQRSLKKMRAREVKNTDPPMIWVRKLTPEEQQEGIKTIKQIQDYLIARYGKSYEHIKSHPPPHL